MADFLREGSFHALTLQWREVEVYRGKASAHILPIPWYRDGGELETTTPDGLCLVLNKEQGLVMMMVESSPERAAAVLEGRDGFSRKIQALTPERALAVATKLIELARECRELREGVDAED